ncbi:arsenate reductase (glutaredoxin) [Alphaproteobacteria bacterium LSUCC0684]
MDHLTIYHNPRCSKSRKALALLQENGVEPRIILYMETPPSADDFREVLRKLAMRAEDLLRKGETEYKDHIAPLGAISEDRLISLMIRHPKVIERPIICKGDKAVIGRPPENVLTLL